MNRPELIMAIHPNGKIFIELDTLIEWFESEPNEKLKLISQYSAYTLKGMRDRGMKNPNEVMTEEQYYRRRGDDFENRS